MTKREMLAFRAIIIDDLNLAYRGAMSDNKATKNNGAYHAQQAIEKTIKLKVLLYNGMVLWGHNIYQLVKYCDVNKIQINIPSLIRKNCNMYTSWEANCRYYPTTVVNRNSLLAVYRVCSEWLNSGNTKIN